MQKPRQRRNERMAVRERVIELIGLCNSLNLWSLPIYKVMIYCEFVGLFGWRHVRSVKECCGSNVVVVSSYEVQRTHKIRGLFPIDFRGLFCPSTLIKKISRVLSFINVDKVVFAGWLKLLTLIQTISRVFLNESARTRSRFYSWWVALALPLIA